MTTGPERQGPGGTRAGRSVLAFGVTALLIGLFGLVALNRDAEPLERLVLVAGPGLLLAVLLVEIPGLVARRSWALTLMTPLLALLIVGGAITFVTALTVGVVQIPFGAILA